MTDSTITRELGALEDALAGRPVEPELAELGELAVALREERPQPAPAFARTLDGRLSRGFPRARRIPRLGVRLPRFTLPALGVAATLVLALVVVLPGARQGTDVSPSGGSSPGATTESSEDSGGSSSSSAEPAPDTTIAPPSSRSAPAVGGSLPTQVPPPSADSRRARSVERTAELTLAARPGQIDTAASTILRVTDQVGGYVVSSTVTSRAGGEFSLRVPERRLQEALTRLGRAGRVRSRTQSAQDITAAVVSARERLTDARTERRSLLRQLAKAATPDQGSSIRRRLRVVSGQIAAAKRDAARVRARAANATVTVTLVAERGAGASADDDGSWTPGDALRDATRVLEVVAGVALVALAVLAPVAILLGLAWLAGRIAARRRRERALDAV